MWRRIAKLFFSVLTLVALCLALASDPNHVSNDVKATLEMDAAFAAEIERIRQTIRSDGRRAGEEEARAVLARAESETGSRSIETARALDLLLETFWIYAERIGSDEGLALSERALGLKRELFGAGNPEIVRNLQAVAAARATRGDRAAARELLDRALEIQQSGLSPDHPDLAYTYIHLGHVLASLKKREEAQHCFQEAIRIQELAGNEESNDFAWTLEGLALIWRMRGNYEEAEKNARRALEIRTRLLDPQDRRIASSLRVLGVLLREMRREDEALTVFDRAVEILESDPAAVGTFAAVVLNGRGKVLTTLGDYQGALSDFERAVAICESAWGDHRLLLAAIQESLGNLSLDRGDLALARSHYEEVFRIREDLLEPGDIDLIGSRLNLSWHLRAMGDHATARPMLEETIALLQSTVDPAHPVVAHALSNLGSIMEEMGDFEEARPLYERAVEIIESAFGPDHPDLSIILNNQAKLLQNLGEYEAAERTYSRALKIHIDAHGGEDPGTGNIQGNFADLLMEMGRLDEAGKRYAEATRILEAALGPHHSLYTESLARLARFLYFTGKPAGALQAALEVEVTATRQFRLTAPALSGREALEYIGILESGMDVALSVVAAGGEPQTSDSRAAAVLDQLIRSRAMVLDETALRHRAILDRASPRTARLSDSLEQSRNRLARLMVSGFEDLPGDVFRSQVLEARAEVERAERALASSSETFRDRLQNSQTGLERVVSSLPPEAVLLAYVRYGRITRGARGSPADNVPSYLALVLRQGESTPLAVPLGEAGAIDALVTRWRELVIRPWAGGEDESAYHGVGTALRRAIWDPVASDLAAADRVFVVPDGPLYLVNLATLPAGEGRYLLETGPQLHYLSAERDLVEESGRRHGTGLLVLGGPDFDRMPTPADQIKSGSIAAAEVATPHPVPSMIHRGPSPECAEFRSIRFAPLTGARAEAEEVVALWRNAELAPPSEQMNVLSLVARDAGEAIFKQHAAGRRVIHLATHGFWVQDRCHSVLTEARDGNRAIEGPRSQTAENPLLLSGLAMAGANLRHGVSLGSDAEDNILTAEEIATLDLRGVEWVVLSACETGLGPVISGEGVLGIRRAFEVAGAETLIMSLWPVGDHDAREWMRRLYVARLDGQSTSQAMRTASLQVLDSRRRSGRSALPFAWGAYVAAGDWR